MASLKVQQDPGWYDQIHINMTAELLKQSIIAIYSQKTFCSLHIEATSLCLWENVKPYKNKLSTYQGGTT